MGKTVVSAIFSEALKACYWKPIQAGDLENSDSIKVSKLTKNVVILEEQFRLINPISPHASAEIDGKTITANSLILPIVERDLIIEGAGGIMVPLSSTFLMVDWLQGLMIPTIVVSRHYLGSINHTLLTIEVLKSKNIKIEGIVFVGDENKNTEKIIIESTSVPVLFRVPLTVHLNQNFILNQADLLTKTDWFIKLKE